METPQSTLLSDLLAQMGVRHTQAWTDARFGAMPFRTLFGLTKLLDSYGVDSEGLSLGSPSQIGRLPLPFVAQTSKGLVIVTSVTPTEVGYISQSVAESAPRDRFEAAMTGKVLVVKARPGAEEPDYAAHRFSDTANRAKRWVLAGGAAVLWLWLFVANGLYAHVSTVLLTLLFTAGTYIGVLLVQKSAHIKNRHADAVCAVVEAGGCDDVLDMPASKFFGIFGWSEVGLAYFGVSLLTLLLFPQAIGQLALINAVCLPFSFWSVWYQRYRAHTWCTLCLCVQSLLWLIFFCFLGGGWLRLAWPPAAGIVALGIAYLTVMLAINAILPLIDRKNATERQ